MAAAAYRLFCFSQKIGIGARLPAIAPIHRYRALALSRLGPSCPTGIIAPEKDELDATLGDWLNEVERVQLCCIGQRFVVRRLTYGHVKRHIAIDDCLVRGNVVL